MGFQPFPAFIPWLLFAAISVGIGILGWRRRPAPGATAFSLMAFSMAIWQFFSALEVVATDLYWMTLLSQLVYLGQGAPTLWLIFALQYTSQGQWATPGRLLLLAIEPVLMVLLVFTTESHHLVWTEIRLEQVGGYAVMVVGHGPAFWFHVIYTYTLMLAGSIALIRSLRTTPLFRLQAAALVGGVLAPWLGNLIYLLGKAPYNMDLTGPGFVIACVLFAWALFRHRLLDLVPLARPVAVQMMREGVAVLDQMGRVAELNPVAQRITGFRDTTAVGKPAAEVLAGQPELVSGLESREPVQLELVTGTGPAARFYDVRLTPLQQEGGTPAGWVIIWHDITERKRREEELRRAWQAAEAASRAKSTFLSNMSHDLRTPLNAIIGYSEILQEEAAERGWHQYLPDLQKIHAAGQHLLGFLSDILDIAKIEAGKMSRSLERFALQPLVEEVVAAVQPVAEQYGNRVQVRGAEGAGEVCQDRAKVRQVLYSVLHNACKFTDQGTVTLTVAREQGPTGEWLSLQVRDTGPGMSREQVDRLFEPYNRVAALRRPRSGAGLGLAIAQRMVHLLEGQITVQSQPGQGSTFTIRLPAQLEEPAAAPTPVLTGTVRAQYLGEGDLSLLVIDDDPTVHDLIRRILTREGFRVAGAPSGTEGIRLARLLRPDLITLDVMMPGLDGWATLAALKADEELAGIPVVMMTSLDDRHMGFKLGAADFIIKPITRERLTRVMAGYRRQSASA